MNPRRATPLLAVAMVLAAATFGIPVLYVPGFGLLAALAAARVWVRLAARRAGLELEPGPRTIVEGDPYPLEVIARSGGLPFPGGIVTQPQARRPIPIAPGSPARLEVVSLRRGWARIAPPTLVISDPLGLASARVPAISSSRVLVLPRIEELALGARPANGSEEALPAGRQAVHGASVGKGTLDFEVDGLRTYRPGTPASRIHWPILARTGDLVERRLVGGGGASPIVVLDAERPIDADALDRAVRAAASLCFHLASAAGCLLILPGEREGVRIDPGLRSWPQAHARLALVEARGSSPAPRIAGRPGTVFWVSATGTVPVVPATLAGGATYLVTATGLDIGRPAFAVAGCEAHLLAAVHATTKARAA